MVTIHKISLAIVAVFCIFALYGGCVEHIDSGFPKAIYFNSEGGEQVFIGRSSFYHYEITDTDNNTLDYNKEIDGYEVVEYDWLKVSLPKAIGLVKGDTLTVTAQPNTTNNKRKLKIYMVGIDSYDEILVVQDGVK
jgi:hypothetical protein